MAKWIQLKAFDTTFVSKPFQINHDEFIVVGNSYDKIFRYSISKDTVTKQNITANKQTSFSAFNSTGFFKNNQPYIYIYTGLCKLGLYDISTAEINFEYSTNCDLTVKYSKYPEMLIIGDDIHIIGGYGDTAHKIINMNLDNKTYEERQVKQWKHGHIFFGHKMIHCQRRNSILLFGVERNADNNVIHEFSLETQKWTELNGIIPENNHLLFSGAVMTSDERYIIFLGGRTVTSETKDLVSVFDVEKLEMKESSIKTPCVGLYKALLIGDKQRDAILTMGWIKKCWDSAESKNFDMTLPNEIIQMIQKFVETEDVHIITFAADTSQHWKIEVDAIIQSV